MKKKGFTLIELLAVIVVLAIIALIATPIVLNLINNAKEGAAKSSATAYVKAVENGVVQELVKNSNGKYTGKFKVDSTGLKLVSDADNNVKITVDVSGKLPKENSYVVLDENGTVTNAYFIIDSYNVQYSDGVANIVKESNNGPTKVEPTSTDTHKGIVYLDPTNLENNCNASNSVSETGTKTGCMKWYIYSEDDNSYNMILDHNTTATVAWISKEDYINAGGTEEKYGEYGRNDKEAITVTNQLTYDTNTWSEALNARLITGAEVASVSNITSWNDNYDGSLCFGSNKPNDISKRTQYAWLYDRTSTNCELRGCLNNSDNETHGYWTSTAELISINGAWHVDDAGYLSGNVVGSATYAGVRPVITVSKSLFK